MSSIPFISLIVPAYNERSYIARTIEEAKAYFEKRGYDYEIIVSADGNDGTRELIAEMAKTNHALKVIGSGERRGKGHGIRQGVAMARGKIIGFTDADNKTPIDEFDKFEPWLRDSQKIVIGTRAHRESSIERAQPAYRKLGSKVFSLFMHLIVGLREIPDTQCGFKFFHRTAAKDLFGGQVIDGYMFDVEILYLAKQKGYRIAQVPIRWRDDGDSRLQLFRGNIRNALDIFRIRFGNRRHVRDDR